MGSWLRRRSACVGLLLVAASAVQAQVAVNQILFPANVGRTLDAEVTIDYTRTSAAAATITTPIPAQLAVNPPAPPAGCTVIAGPAVQCTVPAGGPGASGTLAFNVRGNALGSFSLVATGTGGSSASNTGTVRSSGDVTVGKSKSPAGNLLPGQATTFTLAPQLAAGADDLPAGSTLTITDQLPGTATDFAVSAINAGIASCTSVATANSAARTVTCTYTGPLTPAQINAARITISGSPGTTGTFVNVGSVAAGTPGYFDRDPNNNTASVNYTVDPGGDVQALGSFPSIPVGTGSAQNLTLSFRNNGPGTVPGGGTVATTIPAGFTVSSLPAGCAGPATGVVLVAPAAVSCTVSALASGGTQNFVLGLLMPATAGSGNFPVTVTPPAGFGDSVAANNSVNVPWETLPPFADLRGSKSKSPASGPVAPGTTITTTLTVTNDAASTSTATYSGAGGGTELRVVDYLRPEEIAGDALSAVSAGWTCTVTNNADPADAARSKRVECVRQSSGTLPAGQSIAVSFSTVVATVAGPVTLANRVCAGETVLAQLGLTPAQGPQPPGANQAGNDCAVAGTNLIATNVTGGQAEVSVRKESSIDGTTWFDAPAAAPTLTAAGSTQFWRIFVTTPSNNPQAPIPTLNLSDPLPGILNVGSPGAPAPAYVTPAISVTTQVTAGAAGGGCNNVAAGANNLSCSFTSVAPGTTIVITYAVQRPFGAGLLSNTASVSSPDAILSGTLSDSAAIVAEARFDVAATTKTVTPATPRIGQTIQFTITTQNLGPADVAGGGEFKIVDDLNTVAGAATVGFGDIVASGAQMSCTLAASALADEAALPANHVRVRCTNTTAVARYATRSITITARVLKPGGLPAAGNVYTAQSNTARVDIPDALCEFKTETSSNASVSAACNDAASVSNNSRSVAFDVLVPQIDVQQRKTRVLPAGQTAFGAGQPLRYRFRLQNNGPSRAEGVTMNDQLNVPAGFSLASPQVLNVNGAPAEAGYALDTTKSGTVACTQAAPNANLVCTLAPTPGLSYLDAGREVNFEIELQQSGSTVTPVSFGNEALVCADESATFESAGACNRVAANNNNVAAVNDVIFPRTDLQITKGTFALSPVAINQPVEYRLEVRNAGPSGTQQIRVSDVLPPDFELVTSGPQAPSVTLGAFVTAAPSTATGATLVCNPVPATITAAGQQQTVSCTLNAQPGPLGAGVFPGSPDATNTLTLRLFARPKDGIYAGPYGTDRSNQASVSPGLAADGSPLSIDTVPGNNSASSNVQVNRSSLGGRVFVDRNGSGVQDGTAPAEDEGIGNVTLTLTGVDIFGNPITRTVTTVNTIGATRGDYLFDHLPPGSYTVTETQPTGYNDSPGTPPPATNGGSYTAAASPNTSRWAGVTLPLGVAAQAYNFPEGPPAPPIAGRVFVDRNDNGVLDAGEPGIAGINVGLYPAGTICPAVGALPGGALQTVQTDAVGAYLLTVGIAGSNYVVCQQQPAGHADRPPLPGGNAATPRANQIDITNLPALGSLNNHFPEVLGRIAGTVFLDYFAGAPGDTNNGLQNAGEPGIGSGVAAAGVPMVLTGTPSAGPGAGTPIAPITVYTAADGSYRFDDLLPGSYTVTQGAIPLLLGTYNDGINTAGVVSTGTPGVAGAVGTNTISNIVLGAPAAVSTGNNFAELPRTSIWGQVFVDGDRNGILTSGDTQRLGGVVVELRQGGTSCANATLLGTTTTAANGTYVFPGGTVLAAQVVAGQNYRVCQVQPPAYLDGPTIPGVNGTSNAANQILITSLPLTGSGQNNFGEVVPDAPPPSGPVISGTVFVDRNRDGDLTTVDEGRIGGVTIRLVEGGSCSGPLVATTTTDNNGRYVFAGGTLGNVPLVAGRRYSLCELQPDGYGDGATRPGGGNTTPAPNQIVIDAMPAGGSADNDFGEWAGRITGRVYLDTDDNGAFGSGETGIGGVVITLSGTGAQGSLPARTGLTQPDGSFVFEDLPGGTWTLTEQAAQPTVPVGGVATPTFDGRTTPGTLGGSATAVGTTPSAIGGIVLPPGGQSLDNLFGERLTATPPTPAPDLLVTKAALQARFVVGTTVRYRIEVRNAGTAPTSGSYSVGDRLPAGLTLAAAPAGSGWSCTGAAGASGFGCTSSQVLAAGAAAPAIEFGVNVSAAAVAASPAINAVLVEGGGEPPARTPTTDERSRFDGNPSAFPLCAQPAAHNACRTANEVVQPAALSGTVWLETGSGPRVLDDGDRRLSGWIVELIDPATGSVIRTTTTGTDGRYRFDNLEPGVPYGVRFRDPASGIVYNGPVNGDRGTPAAACNPSAVPSSCGADLRGAMLTVILAPGQELTQQSLPVDPSGVVYDAIGRTPVPGSVVALAPAGSCPGWDPAAHVVGANLGGYVVSGSSIRMTTGADGFYNFVLTPQAPARCTFEITVTPPAGFGFVSALIPPRPTPFAPPGGPGTVVGVQPQPTAPTGNQATDYHLQIESGSQAPDIVHNHIPVDPAAPTSIALRKVADKAVVEIGDSVRYQVTASVGQGTAPRQVTVVDRLPAGFTYIAGTATVGGQRIAEPTGAPGPQLVFQLGGVAAGGSVTLQYRVRVGVGAQDGDGINRANAVGCQVPQAAGGCVVPGTLAPAPRSTSSNEGRARVRVAGGAFGIEACVLGKVYVDCNGNHLQDREEIGIPGVRLVLQDGTFLVSDSEGKYSMCGLPPKSHVLRIDESTLPRGSRLTTSSNRNLGDAGSLWLDLKRGELHRADFIEGSCSNPVLDQVKARRTQGEVSVPEIERRQRPALRFDSKAHGRDAGTTPQQGTDSPNQALPKTRPASDAEAIRGPR